jgi:hydroxypyruvate isomerase
MHNPNNTFSETRLSRRNLIGSAAGTGIAVALSGLAEAKVDAAENRAVVKGRIKQSVAFWCFNTAGEKWDLDTTCRIARELGCVSVELLDPDQWDVLRKHNLICAITPNGMPGSFKTGFNNPRYHEELITRTKQVIDACAAARFPNVITFTGYRWRNPDDPKSGEISREEGADTCVKGLKQLMGHAERKGVNVCMEMLNTRDDSHPMKGHPGYQGDDLEYVAGIIRRVGSPRLKVLFDVYHVQIMHGDVIRRIEQNKEIIGHVHVAGNPGRNELDDKQEINFPPIMRKLLTVGYSGYVGQEFIPTRNPRQSLWQAVRLCDV